MLNPPPRPHLFIIELSKQKQHTTYIYISVIVFNYTLLHNAICFVSVLLERVSPFSLWFRPLLLKMLLQKSLKKKTIQKKKKKAINASPPLPIMIIRVLVVHTVFCTWFCFACLYRKRMGLPTLPYGECKNYIQLCSWRESFQ